MIFHRMPEAKTERQDGHLVFLVIVFGQANSAVEDGQQVFRVVALGRRVGAVALEAESISLGAQEMIVLSAMRRVANGTALTEGRLVMHGLFEQVGNIAVAAETDIHAVGFRQSRLTAGVGIVAVSAIAGSAGMLYLGGLDLLAFVVVAGEAQRLCVGLCEYNLTVFGRRVACVAAIPLERSVLELGHQLGRVGLVRIMALHAVGLRERLVIVRFLELLVVGVVAVETKGGARLGQMKFVLLRGLRTGLMSEVTGIATHIECGVPAAFLRDMQAGLMALAAEVFFFAPGGGLEELILVLTGMRIVAVEAIANRRSMHRSLNVGGLLVCMAGNAQAGWSGGDQLDAGDIFVDADLMATQTSRAHGGMHRFALAGVLVALKALL